MSTTKGLFWNLLVCSVLSLDLEVLTDSYKVMEEGSVLDAWNPDYSESYMCHPVKSVQEPSSNTLRQFTFKNTGYSNIEVTGVSVSASDQGVLLPVVTPRSFTLEPEEKKDVKIDYGCRGDKWAVVYFNFEANGKTHEIKYTKICSETSVSGMDWSMPILLVLALLTVGGSALAAKTLQVHPSINEDANELTTAHAVGFIVCASASLTLLFFFLDYIQVVLTVLVAIGGLSALTFASTYLAKDLEFEGGLEVPCVGYTEVKNLVCFGVSFILMVSYLITRNWVLNNIIGVAYCFFIMKSVKLTSLKVGAILLSMAFFYDIFWVFYSESFFGGNVMVTVATGLDLPVKLQFPHLQSLPISNTCSMVGLGDLALPGLLIAYASRFDHINNTSYLKTQMACYGLALTMCVVVLGVFGAAQPALLYISPMLLGGMVGHAYFREEINKVWKGLSYRPMQQDLPLSEISFN